MKPERLQEIREYASELYAPHRLGDVATVELVAYVDTLQRGARTLGQIIDRQCTELVELTNSHDVIGEDGDGDWQIVWDRLYEMRANLAKVTQQRDDARRIAIDYGAFHSTIGDIMWRGEQ